MVRTTSPAPAAAAAASVVSLDDARDDIRRVGVVGSGMMGGGIAEVCARAGLDVAVRETGYRAAATGHWRVTASLDRGVRRGKLT
ncbi:3-hydroxyacyl-CoA dehydrogenase NAD-binding domain-containing protein [Streptomyces sp. NPDC017435]|uniref:3-hydroxyacyl-CoA dehydrogenase NAD-binding domain-containing protein n=1 Tax=Streptomyces sp. NPDC017435 TaxID=3364995 RepID=UPI00379DF109